MKYLVVIFISITLSSHAANLWTILPDKTVDVKGTRKIIPQKYILVQLNDSLFKSIRSKVPAENSGDFVELELPAPDGQMRHFRMTETTTMEKALADKYPELKTYKAIEINNVNVIAKTDYTTAGFHAMVTDGENTYFIDPYSNVLSDYYICYYKRDYDKPTTDKLSEIPIKKKKCCKRKCSKK